MQKNQEDYLYSANQCAELLRKGELSSEEIVKNSLNAIYHANPKIEAFVQIFEKASLQSAKEADKKLISWRKSGKKSALPAYLGVPSGIKDLEPVKGGFTRLGSRAFRYVYTPFDGMAATHMKKAGFVIMGKLATSEFGALPIVETEIHPPCRNPWNTEYSSGGSSGGTGAAVGSGILPIAQGSDGAGSIRIPSALCHLIGHKAGKNFIPSPYYKKDPFALANIGAMGHSVSDVAGLTDVLRGFSSTEDAHHPQSCLAHLNRPLQIGHKIRIRYALDNPIAEISPEVKEAVLKMVNFFKSFDAEIEEKSFLQKELSSFLPIWEALISQVPVINEKVVGPVPAWLRRNRKNLNIAQIQQHAQGLAKDVLDWFGQETDVMILPTVPNTPPKVGQWRNLSAEELFNKVATMGAFTAIFNVSGQPAINIPMGLSSLGLPIGVQIIGPPGSDFFLFTLAKKIEEAMPWIETSKKCPLL